MNSLYYCVARNLHCLFGHVISSYVNDRLWLRFRFSEALQHRELPAGAAVYPQVQPLLLSHGQVRLGRGGGEQLRGQRALGSGQGLLARRLDVHALQIIETSCCLIHDLSAVWT